MSDFTKFLPEVETGALIEELQNRAEDVDLAPFCTDDELLAETAKRGIGGHDVDRDGVLLKDADFDEIVALLEERGDDGVIFDPDDAERLQELIVERRTDEALDLLRKMAPGAMHPGTLRRLVADRAAESLRLVLA